ncbi:MAG: hypothetical protein PHY47_12635 [Lachnospiraceae bacterium]|nr:hypothetical protein [Lachnospiraceae bacterium]
MNNNTIKKRAKWTEEDVYKIFCLYVDGKSKKEIAQMYNVTYKQITTVFERAKRMKTKLG